MTLLQVREATVHFPKRGGRLKERSAIQALRGVSLELEEGETLAVVGESGCGKSTLARAITGLQPLTSGEVLIHGVPVIAGRWRRPLQAVRNCQMIFQDPYSSLNPKRTVARIIGEPWEIHRDLAPANVRVRLGELLELVGLDGAIGERFPHQLSGGQRQRVGIARALALEPRLLVCDEPVSAVDVSVQAQILEVLQNVQERIGLAYIVITHDLGVVRQIASRVAVLYFGKVVEEGTPSSIYEKPAHPYTQALLQAIPDLYPWRHGRPPEAAADLCEDLPDPSDPPPGCSFAGRCRYCDDRCRQESPELLDRLGAPRPVACHYPLTREALSA